MYKKLILSFFYLWLIQPVNAQIYKCQVEGKTVYSQTPCGADKQEIQLKTQPASSQNSGLREGEEKMLEQIRAREIEKKQHDDVKKYDEKQHLREIQAEATAEARGKECAKQSSLLIKLQQKRDNSHSVSEIRDIRDQMEKLREAMDKIGCD
ncbi:MAG TPA: DUF4124 domain-containing protein [Candidatus Competibacter sp.]|nr:DUF4124 domain-containing protein [Candidatus Competibacter sp.]